VERLDTASERAKHYNHQEQAASRKLLVEYMQELEKECDVGFGETGSPMESYDNQHQEMASPLGSPMSVQSERGRKPVKSTFGKRSNVYSPASSGYQEMVFDSKSPRVGSPGSASSGRRGPLDTAARAAVKAVKALRACWRCKFLRKSVSETSYTLQHILNKTSVIWTTLAWHAPRPRVRLEAQIGHWSDVSAVRSKKRWLLCICVRCQIPYF
jgi:hypothetical protein